MTQARAMFCALAAFFAWVVVDVCIKLGSQAALSPFMIMAVLGSVGAAGIIAQALAKHTAPRLRPQNLRGQSLICLCSVFINYANVIALKHLPLTIFYIVVFTAPLMIAALSSAFRHEALTPGKIACLVAGFAGVVLAVAPQGPGNGEWLGYVAALASTAAFAFYTIVMRKIAFSCTIESTQLLNNAAIVVVGATGALLEASPALGQGALVMMIIAGGINLCGNLLYNKALHHTSSTNVAQLHYTQIISGAILAYLIWQEAPTVNLVAGSIVIIASGMIVAAQARKDGARQTETPP